MSDKNMLDNFIDNKRYRAIETAASESEMRLKSFAIENGFYFLPLVVSIVGWYVFASLKNQSLPWGQSYSFLQPVGFLWIGVGAGLTFFFLKYVKPVVKKTVDRKEKELTEDVYHKGAKFCNLKEFNKSINDYTASENKISNDLKDFETFSIPLNDDRIMDIPRISLATGLCIMGAPGQGKSVLINRIMDEIRIKNSNNTKQVIIDVKVEFLPNFFDSTTDYIICPSDIRSCRFNLVSLLHTQIDTGVLAEILISDDKQTNDPHWVASARAIMEAVLIYASKRNLSNTDIYEMVNDFEALKMMMIEDSEAKIVASQFLYYDGEGTPSKESQSILSTLSRKSKTLQYLKMLDGQDTEKIYLDRWLMNGKPGRLFLLANENLSKVFTPLYGVITSYLISTILNSRDTKGTDYFFFLDELPRLGKALGENLEKGLAVGRSKGLKIITAMQSNSQLNKEFGKEAAESILDTTNSFLVFRNNFGAQFIEKMFGKTTVTRNNESFSMGMSDSSDRTQLARQLVKESLIDESEISRLDKFEFYARIEGCKDILKEKLAPKFVKSNGTDPYIENPKMKIQIIVDQMKRMVKPIENKYVNFNLARKTTKKNSTSIKIAF